MAYPHEKETPHQARAAILQQEIYVSIPLRQQIVRWEVLRTFPIARQSDPAQACGYAHRIGSVDDLALYRLKIYDVADERNTLTLPGLFFLNQGTFHIFSANDTAEPA